MCQKHEQIAQQFTIVMKYQSKSYLYSWSNHPVNSGWAQCWFNQLIPAYSALISLQFASISRFNLILRHCIGVNHLVQAYLVTFGLSLLLGDIQLKLQLLLFKLLLEKKSSSFMSFPSAYIQPLFTRSVKRVLISLSWCLAFVI